MYEKDYKSIARIIQEHLVGNDLLDTAKEIAEHLADYFEKEEKEYWKPMEQDKQFDGKHPDYFNRKQFFKDCGIK